MLNDKLNVYPQPTNDFLNIECSVLNDDENLEIKIFNRLGQLAREEEIVFRNRISKINTSNLPEGVYTLSITTQDNFTINKRVVVSR